MRIVEQKTVQINDLIPAEWNYKNDALGKMERFKQSLKSNGLLYRLVVAQQKEKPNVTGYEVCDGNHRLQALKSLGITEIPVYYMGALTKPERMKLGIELNEWVFETDPHTLGKCLKEIDAALPDLDSTGFPYDSKEIDDLISLTDAFGFDDDLDVEDEPEGEIDDLVNIPAKKNDSVPEVTMIFATHTEYTEFVQTLGFEQGQRVNYAALKDAIIARYGNE